jgi:hypothetical protein
MTRDRRRRPSTSSGRRRCPASPCPGTPTRSRPPRPPRCPASAAGSGSARRTSSGHQPRARPHARRHGVRERRCLGELGRRRHVQPGLARGRHPGGGDTCPRSCGQCTRSRPGAVVVFVSEEYAQRNWTRLERRSALHRAVREWGEYVLPARFDNTLLPELLPGVAYVDLRKLSPLEFAERVAAKLARLGIIQTSDVEPAMRAATETRQFAGPARAVRVAEADPRRLGCTRRSACLGRGCPPW